MPVYALGDVAPELPADGDYWIAPTAVVIGKVKIHSGVGIWWGAVIRGDTEEIEIGPGTNVQDNAVFHTDPGIRLVVGANCTIGHSAIVHGATIGDGTLVGMGSTILNRAVIGAGSLIGANALVKEGSEIPERSLVVGAPATVKRTLDDAMAADLLKSAEGYQERMRRYRGELAAVG